MTKMAFDISNQSDSLTSTPSSPPLCQDVDTKGSDSTLDHLEPLQVQLSKCTTVSSSDPIEENADNDDVNEEDEDEDDDTLTEATVLQKGEPVSVVIPTRRDIGVEAKADEIKRRMMEAEVASVKRTIEIPVKVEEAEAEPKEDQLQIHHDDSVSEIEDIAEEAEGDEASSETSLSSEPTQKTTSRASVKPRAPEPPSPGRRRSSSFTSGTCSHVKSSTLVRFNRQQPCNFKFLQLNYNTNLKKAPENWVRLRSNSAGPGTSGHRHGQNRHGHTGHASGKFGSYFWSYPFSRSSSWSMFSSFRMANQVPDIVGEVDVISDAENIKKLLKVPFSNSHLSMFVHRIGKTLLIDEFDLSKLLLGERMQWTWLKNFLAEQINIGNDSNKKIICRRNTSRSYLQSKNMFRKFLQHSIVDSASGDESSEDEAEAAAEEDVHRGHHRDDQPRQIFGEQQSTTQAHSHHRKQNHSTIEEITHQTDTEHSTPTTARSLSPVPPSESSSSTSCSEQVRQELSSLDLSPDYLARELDLIECSEGIPDEYRSSHLRDILWTFENIQMLVGSDMPIFGDSEHPAVSLRLRDSSKPINVLTGIDYWLDNLMCSVPEVVMCYHLDGIIKKYELLKTEDIPQMKHSRFSPKVIRDIAQNILTFLKTKATKSGHTYWLLKSKEGDVVKLYDLTTLCENYYDESSKNPYALPVAMLLYRVAKHLVDTGSKKLYRVYNLLQNCLKLIDQERHQKISVSAQYLLAVTLVPHDVDPSVPAPVSPDELSESDEEYYDDSQSSTEESCNDSFATLYVKELTKDRSYTRNKAEQSSNSGKKRKKHYEDCVYFSGWQKRGFQALKFIVDGLRIIMRDYEKEKVSKEEPRVAKPFEPIPMPYHSLNPEENPSQIVKVFDQDNQSLSPSSSASKAKSTSPWKAFQTVLFLRKSAQIYCVFSDLAISSKLYKKALKYIKLGLLCNETAENLLPDTFLSNDILPCLLGLSGDCHFLILKEGDDDYVESQLEFEEEFSEICQSLLKDYPDQYSWCYNSLVSVRNSIEEKLQLSARCYEEALTVIENTKVCSLSVDKPMREELKNKLQRKYGNICNELSCMYMNEVTSTYEETSTKNEELYAKLETLTKTSLNYLKTGIEALEAVNDTLNCVLLYSNTGKLMRICAYVFTPVDPNTGHRSEFSPREKHFYIKSINYYETAFRKLASVSKESGTPVDHIWDQINWDLCTTLFTMATLIQDYAPLSYCAFEDIERDIRNYFARALQLCAAGEERSSSKLPLYQYRAATINYKLGSLIHHTFRNLTESDPKRRKIFQEADTYYEEAQQRFLKLDNKQEYLKTILERVGMHERMLSSCGGFGSKVKSLHTIMEILSSAEKCSKMEANSDENQTEMLDYLALICERLYLCVQGLLKQYSSKQCKYKENIKRWKSIEGQLSSSLLKKLLEKKPVNLNGIQVYVWNLCEKCYKALQHEK